MHTIQVVSMCYQYCGLVCSVATRCHRKKNSTMMEIKTEWMAWQQNRIHGIFFNGKEVFPHTGMAGLAANVGCIQMNSEAGSKTRTTTGLK